MLQSSRFWNRHGASYSRRSAPDDEAYRRTLALTQDYLPTGAGVPELGCGTGTTAIHHAPHAVHITTGDVSVGMLQIARDRAANAGAKNVSFVEAEAAAYNGAGPQPAAPDAGLARHGAPDPRDDEARRRLRQQYGDPRQQPPGASGRSIAARAETGRAARSGRFQSSPVARRDPRCRVHSGRRLETEEGPCAVPDRAFPGEPTENAKRPGRLGAWALDATKG